VWAEGTPGGSVVLWHAKVLRGLENGCDVCGSIVQVAASTKTNRVGAAARQSQVLPLRAHVLEGKSPPNGRGLGKRTRGMVPGGLEGSREGV